MLHTLTHESELQSSLLIGLQIIADESHSKKDRRRQQTMKRREILKAKKIKSERRSPSKKDEIPKIDQKLNRVQILQLPKDGYHKAK